MSCEEVEWLEELLGFALDRSHEKAPATHQAEGGLAFGRLATPGHLGRSYFFGQELCHPS